ncbi:hypothetical protein G1H11_21830 [Phytoactinopolyspora alkaliphila]|uniref:Uncharacterized protein n=1 Tax=Phytoactinopolyspora alkaliphila TaxID=1783498 RepID=A0A6N9YSC1_9ACTN|nr:hypothetical protein [Phytoactinopolyspora alkaliphila]NED97943.1 hypothetical protein [Phytoactinopolyspora alkaliphila]
MTDQHQLPDPGTESLTETPASCSECNDVASSHGEPCGTCGLYTAEPKPQPDYATFITLTTLPYVPPRGDCCAHAQVEVRADFDRPDHGAAYVVHTHSTDCDVWMFLEA